MFILTFLYSIACTAQEAKNHFKSGERLEFVIYYGILDAGFVEADLEMVEHDGLTAYHSRMLAKSTGLADRLYKVRDEYHAVFDPVSLLPLQSIRDVREGRYEKYNFVTYDYDSLKALNSQGEYYDIPPDVRDMVTVFHYIRNADFPSMKSGDIIKINTFFDNEIFPFDMRFRGTEIIKTRKGSYQCYKLVPYVEPGRIFNTEDDMTIWLSADRNRVPIRVKMDLKVGSIKVDLIEYSGLKY